jgi:O-antigen ligase
VGARFDYWEAAVRTVIANPLFGTGPGTFYIPYRQIKRPESEPAKLVHNDYLEQASDSGLPGFLAYAAFIVGILAWTAPRTRQRPAPSPSASKLAAIPFPSTDWEAFLVWLGLLGWALQGLMEFGLYIPALAWPAFSLMGWLLGSKLSAGCDEIPSRPERGLQAAAARSGRDRAESWCV